MRRSVDGLALPEMRTNQRWKNNELNDYYDLAILA